jgi:uncharacterized protein (TIGR02217 family)
MTTPPSFPVLVGQGWSVHKKPLFSTIVANHVSGREVRDALYENPIWQFEATFVGLDSTGGAYGGLGASSLQALMGFFLECQGQYQTFLYTDPTDSVATNTIFATGDGVTTNFTFARFMGSFLEPIGWLLSVTNVYLNGVNTPAAGNWSTSAPNTLTFVAAPAIGATIAATFTYAFQCRFDSDDLDFEQFMQGLWKADSVKFRSVRTS